MGRFYTNTLILTIFFLIFSSSAYAVITGTVNDASGNPVSDALIVFTDESDTTKTHSGVTDSSGKYSIILSSVSVQGSVPAQFSLKQNFPNPFNPTTVIPFSLDKSGFLSLIIYNVTGQKIKTLVDGYHNAGQHSVVWNGLDSTGDSVGAGLYIYKLAFGGQAVARKMLLIDGGGSYHGSAKAHDTFVVGKAAVTTTTCTVRITGEDIVPFTENGIQIVDNTISNYLVYRYTEHNGFNFVSLPGGTFEMGDVTNDRYHQDRDRPVHTVTLSPFEMGVFEITNAQYAAYLNDAMASDGIEIKFGDVFGKSGEWSGKRYLDIGYNNSGENKGYITLEDGVFGAVPDYESWPVIAVSWFGAKAFAQSYGFDLPREAEWEYSCRGGKMYLYGTADGILKADKTKANYASYVGHPVDVGSYPANPFGLHDLSGNVFEWCHDFFGNYTEYPQIDPTGYKEGPGHVMRGGHFSEISGCRASWRNYQYLSHLSEAVGFRIVKR